MCNICADMAAGFRKSDFITDGITQDRTVANNGGLSFTGPLSWLDVDERGGVQSATGKTSLTTAEAAAQITRDGRTWATGGLGQAVTVTYSFRSTEPGINYAGQGSPANFTRFSATQIQAAELMLTAWSDVAGISFQRLGSGTSGEGAYNDNAAMVFANYSDASDGSAAYAYYPGTTQASGDVWINASRDYNVTPTYLAYGYQTMVHEIGHAIGLGHPGSYNAAPGVSITYAANAEYYEDTRQYSVMSYFGASNTGANHVQGGATRYASAPLLDDIAAAQRLYGANMTTRTGDTVYGFNSTAGRIWYDATQGGAAQNVIFAVWDAGGIDTLDFSGYATGGLIDLRQGHFSSVGSLTGNVAIAIGAVIENAIGGSGSDTLIGNGANNVLRGNGGNNILDGGAGVDTAVFSGAMSGYTIVAGTEVADGVTYQVLDVSGLEGTGRLYNIEFLQFADGTIPVPAAAAAGIRLEGDITANTLTGTAYADWLFGADGADIINAGAGDDRVAGGRGSDTLNGGDGMDLVDYSGMTAAVVVNLATGTATEGAGDGGGVDTLTGFENVRGTTFGDTITGDGGANRIDGNGGVDSLNGAGGDDFLIAGAGQQTSTPQPDVVKAQATANTSRPTAINIDGGFDLSNDAGIGNATTVPHATIRGTANGSGLEYYAFTVTAGATSVFDIASVSANFDSTLEIVDANGVRVAFNDDESGQNAGITHTFANAGTYYVVVGQYSEGSGSTVVSVAPDAGRTYVLNVSIPQHPVVGLRTSGSILDGGDGNDTLVSGLGDDTLTGGAGTDTASYSGLRSAYTITDTGGGAFTIAGPQGTDTLSGVERVQFSDQLVTLGATTPPPNVPTAGNDVLVGTAGDDLIDGLAGDDAISGLGGSDSLFGNAGDDTLQGGDGNDVLVGGVGNDILVGGAGIDFVAYGSEGGPGGVTVNLQAGTATDSFGGTDTLSGVEYVVGTAFADTIFGDAADNQLDGMGGDDTLFGGDGIDVLNGGDGVDILVGNDQIFAAQRDVLNGGAGDDILYGEAVDELNGGEGRDSLIAVNSYSFNLDMAATSIEYAILDFGDDVINAAGQSVRVDIFASGGNDAITGSNFDDLIFAGVGDDVVVGGDGNDALVGQGGIDYLDGGAGDDRIYFDAQDSFVSGGVGYDAGYITQGTGAGALVNMGASSLEFIQDLAGEADTILGLSSATGFAAFAGGGADVVDGSDLADVIWGEAGDDSLSGNAGDDVLVGGEGLDVLNGGAGNDALYGGAGDGVSDTFSFAHFGAANADAVYDFVAGIDKIDLSAFGSSFASVSIATSGADSVVYLNGELICTVVGVVSLTASDFIMAPGAPADPGDGFANKSGDVATVLPHLPDAWADEPLIRPELGDTDDLALAASFSDESAYRMFGHETISGVASIVDWMS